MAQLIDMCEKESQKIGASEIPTYVKDNYLQVITL